MTAHCYSYRETKVPFTSYGSFFAYNFEDVLDIPLDFPYTREEWDIIFATYIGLLTHQEPWLRLAAIAKIKKALNCEQTQVGGTEEYKPRSIEERINSILPSITSLVVEDFYNEFKDLDSIESYQPLVSKIKKEHQSLIFNNNNYLQILKACDLKKSVLYINGYLDGISQLCDGLNYVPVYQAIYCPQIYPQMTKNIENGILSKFSRYRMSANRLKSECKCSNFESVTNWENIWDNLIDKWIAKRLFGGNYQIKDKFFSFDNFKATLIRSIEQTLEGQNPIVWKFTVGNSCSDTVGFGNEGYAFRGRDVLFTITFGWFD